MKENTRDKILQAALELIQVQGFNNTGIGQILQIAAVPKGSFYHYFPSKDDLGYALIDLYSERVKQHVAEHFAQHPGPALLALRSYYEQCIVYFCQDFGRCNCLLGNLAQELSSQHQGFRLAVRRYFLELEQTMAQQLRLAQAQGDLAQEADAVRLAQTLFAGWEGALMRAKLEQNPDVLHFYIAHFFEHLPRPAPLG